MKKKRERETKNRRLIKEERRRERGRPENI